MANELNLHFPDRTRVVVTLNRGVPSPALPFASPLSEKDHADIHWYLETYGAHSLGDPDDGEAARIAGQLPVWGRALFKAVFTDEAALKRYFAFQQMERDARLLTVSAEDPAILALPWELLHDPAKGGGFLFLENPRISIRRRVQGLDDGREPFDIEPKDRVHLLFVVSRPDDTGFLDPRADSLPVLDAIDEHAPGRVTWEFLRPPTLDALLNRLEDDSKPAVDILHFDGHGVFDRHGGLPERAAQREGSRFPFQEPAMKEARANSGSPPNTGYLLFETPEGKPDFVSAAKLGANLNRHHVALVILSACQSAAVSNDSNGGTTHPDAEQGAMGSVAARLTATGIPSVLAMTHSVLVYTTRALFGEFYKELARSKGIGEALDNARRYLANHPQKYEVQRGPARVPLQLYDWFLPALYQPGADGPLLLDREEEAETSEAAAIRSNLPPAPEAGFYGRRRPLWDIERWFAASTRRITITGFGGQGKTALALEAGRWLSRTGMFPAAAFLNYAHVKGADAIAVAVSTIGTVLGESLIDVDAATKALKKSPTLVILDNLEALEAETLQALLDAAVKWSEAGGSRVLCTTRRPTFNHAAYKVEGTVVHRRIQLDGLGTRSYPDDALEWFAALMKLPPTPTVPAPKRTAIIDLFAKVKFHPLSIRVLTQQLKTRRPAEVFERLEELLAAPRSDTGTVVDEDTPASLLASLQLSLDRLDATARELLPRLGVFQGGAMESLVEEVLTAETWPVLREQLEGAALIEAETIPGVTVPFFRFHPTLAPMLWSQLNAGERAEMTKAYSDSYYALSSYLYTHDKQQPHEIRAIAWREWPNLLRAADIALDAREPYAVDFADNVIRFASGFGFRSEISRLSAKAEAAAEKGTETWLVAQHIRADQLRKSGNVREAIRIYEQIDEAFGGVRTRGRAIVLGQLGRCYKAWGLADQAERYQREALAITAELPQDDDSVKRERSILLTDLGDVLALQGRYVEARNAYEEGLAIKKEVGDLVGQGVSLGQLGGLARRERGKDWVSEALSRHHAAIALFEQLRDPGSQAVGYHQLGLIYEDINQLDEAEKYYRIAARIRDELGDVAGARSTWNQLARVSMAAGKLTAAEEWLRKAIASSRASHDYVGLSVTLSNLAAILLNTSGSLEEARQLAEESLKLTEMLDPDVGEIWSNYWVLGTVCDQESEVVEDPGRAAELKEQARNYRRRSREARLAFAGARHQLRAWGSLIMTTIVATSDSALASFLEEGPFRDLEQKRWTNLVTALRRIVAGERNADVVCDRLDLEDSVVVQAVLQGIADPSSIADLLPEETS